MTVKVISAIAIFAWLAVGILEAYNRFYLKKRKGKTSDNIDKIIK